MLLSIIIPTLNESRYLPRLLDSIDKQDFHDYEILVADAGSTDGTRELAAARGCKIVAGGSPARGRNLGARAAAGSMLLFLDADVVLPERFLATAVSEFQRRNLGIAGFRIVPIDGILADRIIYVLFDISARITGRRIPNAGMVTLVNAAAHRAVGGFDEQAVFMEDFLYTLRVSRTARYRYLPYPFSVSMRRFRKYGRSLTYVKYVLGGAYVLFVGPIHSNIFHYRFDGYRENNGNVPSLFHPSVFWQAVSLLGPPLLYVLAMLWILLAGQYQWLWRVLITIALVELICWGIKFFYKKDRPVVKPRRGFFSNLDANSFPSIHTARTAALAMLYFAGNPTLLAFLAAAAVTVVVG
ncbi:MAG: glycosyltransferase, partial [Candidatus Saccharimonadales bacterium]